MKKLIVALLALSMVVAACGDDDAAAPDDTVSPDSPLTAAEREWCTLADTSDATALRFDEIFEGGLALGLPMDALNAQAAELRTQYQTDGMSDDEAVAAVGAALLDEPVFQQACKEAYFQFSDNG